jgi:hypothetical protein
MKKRRQKKMVSMTRADEREEEGGGWWTPDHSWLEAEAEEEDEGEILYKNSIITGRAARASKQATGA